MKLQKANIDGTEVFLVDGVPQSTYPPSEGGYWRHMIPQDFSGKKVLLLGVGAGTIARLLLDKYPDVEIIGVDNSDLVITMANQYFKLDEIKMEIIIQDGFEYIEETKKKFDLILVDMWNGYWFPARSLMKEFIDKCKDRLNKGGQVYINAPNLDCLAQESLPPTALRNDIGRNIIYSFDKSEIKE